MKCFEGLKLRNIKTPCFVINKKIINNNLRILASVQKKANCKVLLALKAYAMYSTFPQIKKHLSGVCAGSLYEAKLGREEFGREVHTYSPAFKEDEFPEVLKYSDYIVFNSILQHKKYMPLIKARKKIISAGIRVNPEKSVAGALYKMYDPCVKNSGLGVLSRNMKVKDMEGITGLHFHALCEQGTDELELVLEAFKKKFDEYLKKVSWVNFGGGHHITKKGYDVDKLIRIIKDFRKQYPNIKDVYLEPGEAVVLNAGVLVASVLDIIPGSKNIAVLDTSVETHLPDVMITRNEPVPYIQPILGAQPVGKGKKWKKNSYVLRGVSCAAGDFIGNYTFNKPLKTGDKLVFGDAAHYTMVKVSTFCGVNLPSIAFMKSDGSTIIVKRFGYKDYKSRLS